MKTITHIKFLTLLVIILGTYQCRPKPLEVDLPEQESEIVVFCQVIPDQVMTVALTRTLSTLEFSEENGDTLDNNILDNILVSGAEVLIDYDGQTDTLFETTPGIYLSLFTLQLPNLEYNLRINKDGKQLSSSSEMLPQIKFETITPKIIRNADDTLVTIEFMIEDFPENNWYMINFYKRGENFNFGIDLNNFFPAGSNIQTKTVLLNDITFDSPNYSGIIELPQILQTDSIAVTISNINEPYYKFLSLRNQSQNIFSQITKEPISYPTNIENGLGFFNTHFPDIKLYDLNDF